ncbi:unnamed protein product [Orchesella dallaii]|uniref:Uncharacterized protein n=1 Tax=Orchesella dallaii TaxID=48710 RepID=A0ABP1RTH0_9HEXA
MSSSCDKSAKRGSRGGSGPGYHHHPILDHQLKTLAFGYPMAASASQSKDGDSNSSWTKLFPIGKACGVNLQTPVFEFKEEDSRREYQVRLEVLVERETSHSQKSRSCDLKKEWSTVGYLSSSLTAIVTKSIGHNAGGECGDEEEYAMFVIGLCACETCSKKKVNTLEVEPMEVTMKLRYFKDLARNVLLSFFPGVTSAFKMKEEASRCRRRHFVYYSSFLPLSALNIYPFVGETGTSYVFQDRIEGEASRFMTKWTPSVVEITKIGGMKPLRYDKGMKMAKPDMVLVSSEVQSPVFEDKLILMQNAKGQSRVMRNLKERVKFELTENSLVTEVFIKCLYNGDVLQLLRSLDFEAIVGVLQLASQYQLMNMLGTVSTLLIQKLQSADVIQLSLLWRLYEVLDANSTIQVVVQLKEKFLRSNAVERLLQQIEGTKLSEHVQNTNAGRFLVKIDTKNVLQDLLQCQTINNVDHHEQ